MVAWSVRQPGGPTQGSRNKLAEAFIADVWKAGCLPQGRGITLPKNVKVDSPFSDISDDELAEFINYVEAQLGLAES